MAVDLSRRAGKSTVVSRARVLAEWVGAGRPVTAKGVLRPADVADAGKVIGVDVPARVRTAADVHELHHAWLVAQAAGWLCVDGDVAVAGAPAADDLLEVWYAGLTAVLREESHDRRRRGAMVACRAVLTALATDPPTPREDLEETVHALLHDCQPGDATAMYGAFRRGMMPVDAALEVLADFGAVNDVGRPALTPLGRWAWQQFRRAGGADRPDTADLSAADLLATLAPLDDDQVSALVERWFADRPLADGCSQLLDAAAGSGPVERVAAVDLVASFGATTLPLWRAAKAAPALAAHAAAVLAYWDAGPEPTSRQRAWLATEYALATLATDGVENAYYEVHDFGGLAALDVGAHPDLALLRHAVDAFTASGGRLPVFQLKITLDRMRPPVWRRVLVSAGATLGHLHRIIQVVLDWDDDHLHAFTTDSGRYADPYYELDDCDDEEGIRLSRALPRAGATIEYVYDFGASWYHTITLEKIDRPETPPAHPVCLTGRGDAPVEDWNPDGNTPDTTPFDRDRLNQRLATLAGSSTAD